MSSKLTGKRVLIVEDEAMIAELIGELVIDEGGFVVGPAAGLDEALALARDAAIDVAVLDVNLAGVRSFPIADVLRSRGIPFLFATGYGDDAVSAAQVDAPVIGKPFKLDTLVRSIEDLIA